MNRRSFLAVSAAVTLPVPAAAAWAPSTFKLSWWEAGVSGWREVTGVARGCWGIHQDSDLNCPGITLTHLPSGYRAAWSEDEGVMERFADVLDRIADFPSETVEGVREKDLRTIARHAAQKAGLVRIGGQEWAAGNPT